MGKKKNKKKEAPKMGQASKKPISIPVLLNGKEIIRVEISTCSSYESVKAALESLSHQT